ncbi:MAG: S8 family serine peptidase [Defluviitaleaceae bacterium]|nr:S8 family serine peptidase [Defluviitaleaceae bacterium]
MTGLISLILAASMFYGGLIYESSPVNVIVLFNSSPTESAQAIEDDHALFRRELSYLFASPLTRNSSYSIVSEFRRAFSGVILTLPPHLIDAVMAFESVRDVHLNVQGEALRLEDSGASPTPLSRVPGHARMGAYRLHEEGIRGEGVVIAVIDTGIDWMHPAFSGSFPTIKEMQRRNPDITNEDGINFNGTYYFVGRDFIHRWPGLCRWQNPTASNPMETSPIFFPDSHHTAWTSHGTHVAGTIVARDFPGGKYPARA